MTSMLLTDRITRLLLLAAVPHRVAELLALLDGGRLDLGADDLAHRGDPVRDQLPLLAVPLLHPDAPVALVVLARDLDRVPGERHAELLEPLLREGHVLEAPADLLARGHRLGALHPRADRLGGVHRVDDAAVVERLAH